MNRTNGSNPPPPPGMVKPPPPPNPPSGDGVQTLSDRLQRIEGMLGGPDINRRRSYEQLQRIEDKLDTLIAALADGEDGPGVDLDGQPNPLPRDETTTL